MTNFGWTLPAGCTLNEIDELYLDGCEPELPAFQETDLDSTSYHMRAEITATVKTIAECSYTDASARAIFTLGALTGMLKGLAGIGDYPLHAGLFDPASTEAIRLLVAQIAEG